MPQLTTNITISTATIVKVVAVMIGLWALYLISDIVLLLIASLLLAAALDPYVDRLQTHGIPRSVSMIGIYLILFSIVSIALILIIPPVLQQINTLAVNFPNIYKQYMEWIGQFSPSGAVTNEGSTLPDALSTATQGVFTFVTNIFGGIFSFLTVIVLTFYLVIDEGSIKRLVSVAPQKYQAYLSDLYERLQTQIGIWLRAQLILMLAVGVLTYLALSFINLLGYNMPYVLTLSLIAGLTEFLPYVGPIIGAVPAMFIAYNVSPTLMVAVGIAYYAIQTLENNVLVPKIMERALGLSPIISILVFLVGAKLAGITGAFLAIPIATAGVIIFKDAVTKRRPTSLA
jgi:predicted PurR-regulated permease PerM